MLSLWDISATEYIALLVITSLRLDTGDSGLLEEEEWERAKDGKSQCFHKPSTLPPPPQFAMDS